MIDILDLHFPEDNRPPDVLLGFADDGQGNASAYFGSLDESDRDIVQHYVQNFIPPVGLLFAPVAHDVESYVLGLVSGYVVVDPGRKSYEGVQSAIREVARLRRYVEMFVESTDYFPWLGQCIESYTDDFTGELLTVASSTWIDIDGSGDLFDKRYLRQEARDRTLPYIEAAAEFIADPTPNQFFDQDYILYKHEQNAWGG